MRDTGLDGNRNPMDEFYLLLICGSGQFLCGQHLDGHLDKVVGVTLCYVSSVLLFQFYFPLGLRNY